jgi:hypothetical protein
MELGTYIVFGLGILIGAIGANKDFRVKFFKGFRKFLGGVGKSTHNLDRQYGQGKVVSGKTQKQKEEPLVQHVYREVHQRITCPVCGGSGRVYEKVSKLQEGALGYKPEAIDCPECKGEGRVWN